MIEDFDKLFENFQREHGAHQSQIDDLVSFSAFELPSDYLELLRRANGLSGWLRNRYLIIYSTEEAITINRAASVMKRLPGKLIFGSNGGGTSYLLEAGRSAYARVYRCEDVDLTNEELTHIASSMYEFLERFGREVG
jgi:hypothetical protein